MIFLFACFVGWLNSLPIEKKLRHNLIKNAWAAWAGMNTGMRVQ